MKRTPIKPGTKQLRRRTFMHASKAPINRAGMATVRERHQVEPADPAAGAGAGGEGAAAAGALPPPGNRPAAGLLRKTRLKTKGPKMTPTRRAARGEECTFRFSGICNRDPATSVWCHSNRAEHGKGAGIKARDEHGCIGCSACHAFYDGGYANAGWTRADVEMVFDTAAQASRVILQAKGVLVLEAEATDAGQ